MLSSLINYLKILVRTQCNTESSKIKCYINTSILALSEDAQNCSMSLSWVSLNTTIVGSGTRRIDCMYQSGFPLSFLNLTTRACRGSFGLECRLNFFLHCIRDACSEFLGKSPTHEALRMPPLFCSTLNTARLGGCCFNSLSRSLSVLGQVRLYGLFLFFELPCGLTVTECSTPEKRHYIN